MVTRNFNHDTMGGAASGDNGTSTVRQIYFSRARVGCAIAEGDAPPCRWAREHYSSSSMSSRWLEDRGGRGGGATAGDGWEVGGVAADEIAGDRGGGRGGRA